MAYKLIFFFIFFMRNKNFYQMCISRIYKIIYGNDLGVISIKKNNIYSDTKKLLKLSTYFMIKFYFCAPDFVAIIISDFI